MSKRFWLTLVAILTISMFVLAGCTTPTEAPAVEDPVVEDPVEEEPVVEDPVEEEPLADAPSVVRFASITSSTIEQPWWTAFAQAFERVSADAPHGLEMTLDVTENVAPPDAERVLREYAQSGNYDIIWAHSSYSDAVVNLMAEFPDIAWVYSGSGNDPYGDNAYWVDVYIHEPSYLAGIVAGSITETNVLGAVGAFPFPNVNIPLNAFLDGAQSVNPDVEMKVTYIESWFDPPKAKESALAQVAAGADIVYAERFGPFEACNEEGCLAFGHFLDQTSLAPEIVIGSPEARWDPNIVNIIDEWWNHVVDGVAYDAPMDRILFGFVDGGSDIAWNPGLMDLVPQEVWDEVETARLAILSGELIVELNEAPLGE